MAAKAPTLRPTAAILSMLLCLLTCGCLHPRLPPQPQLSVANMDTGCLKGKVIVIDPGHGGPERGAVGRRGVSESEVNLGVALHLWGLLKKAGADPVLTRSTDQSLYQTQEFDLQQDLQLRADASNAAGADLFISIHHNSSARPQNNKLLVFYKMSDPYRSRDAARAIGSALERALGKSTHSIIAGNYHVLRNTQAPALLGEASFMTHNQNESQLAFTRTLATEAMGYFQGILGYYHNGVPQVTGMQPAGVTVDDEQPLVSACLDPGHDNATIDFTSLHATIDGRTLKEITVTGSCVTLRTPLLTNRLHNACISFRNSLGNSSGARCASFAVSLPPQSIEAASSFPVIPVGGMASTAIDITVRDRLGRPVIDETPVLIATTAGSLLQAETVTSQGHAHAILASADSAGTATVSAASGSVRTGLQVTFGTPASALFMASVRDTAGQPVHGVNLIRGRDVVARSDLHGFIYDSTPDGGPTDYLLDRRGYSPRPFTACLTVGTLAIENLTIEPIDDGVFFSRTIMLDPEGKSSRALPLLELLKQKIDAGGGRAHITWQALPAPPYRNRVMQATARKADLFLTIDITRSSLAAGYYHKSKPGQDFAQQLQTAFAEACLFGRKELELEHSNHYAVIHTTMPAVKLELPRKALKKTEAVAEALYQSLRHWLKKQ